MSDQPTNTDNDTGNDGINWDAVNAEAQIAGQDRAAFSADAYTYTGSEVRANFNTAHAISTDERGHTTRHTTPTRHRSWQSRRASYRAHQAQEKRARTVRHQMQAWWYPRLPGEAYAKGNREDTTQSPGLLAWLLARLGLS